MLKDEFLLMMHQDLETKKDETLEALLDCIEEVLKEFPNNTDIDPTKTVEDCYSKMYEYARKNQKKVIGPQKAKEFVIEYLKLNKDTVLPVGQSQSFVKLEDFI